MTVVLIAVFGGGLIAIITSWLDYDGMFCCLVVLLIYGLLCYSHCL